MTAPSWPGSIHIAAAVRGDAITAARIACRRPPGIGAMLADRPAGEIPALAARLHALCAGSHAAAARAALAAAGAIPLAAGDDRPALAAERLVDHLRATVIGLGTAAAASDGETQAIRAALALGGAAIAGQPVDPAALARTLARLGLTGATPPAGSWAGRLIAMAARLPWRDDVAADTLGPDDDAAVVAALIAAGEAFATRPHLPGRRPATGPSARIAPPVTPAPGGGDRLAARFAEIVHAADLLAAPEPGGAPWLRAGSVAPGVGFAAVESPRGRLYHLAEGDRQGRIRRYLILPPTEWTFAPEGPFALALRRLRLSEAWPAREAIGHLAALFDPCLACTIDLTLDPEEGTADA